MRINLHFFIGFLCMAHAGGAFAAANYTNGTPGIASQYGLIQNVQNYSSNPFWDPNGPYNQRMPQAVYVQGADLNTGDCQRTVATLVAAYCSGANNCVGMTLSDVRPTLMMQLSRLPGHNYASACAGFIDTEFQSYVSKYATAAPTGAVVPFPTATVPNTATEFELKLENPYTQQLPTWNGKSWAQDALERKQELQNLQSQNGAGNEKLARASFPTTAADLSFSQRMQNKAAGYEPFKDSSAYRQLNIESEEKYMARKQAYCQQGISTQVATLQSDLAILKKCKQDGVKFADCRTQGIYR